MPVDYIPSTDADLDAWATNFDTKITAAPTSYGLVAGDATAFAALRSDFTTKLASATNPATRTSVSIAAKNTSRAALVFKARSLSQIVTRDPDTTNAQRAELGITPRDSSPTPAAPPATRPQLAIDTTASLQNGIRVVDELTPSSRAKPPTIYGAVLFTAYTTGAVPADADYAYAGVSTRNQHVVSHPAGSGGKICYMKARWINSRGVEGPVSNVVTTTVAA